MITAFKFELLAKVASEHMKATMCIDFATTYNLNHETESVSVVQSRENLSFQDGNCTGAS